MDSLHQTSDLQVLGQNEQYSLQSLTDFLSKTKIKSADDRHQLEKQMLLIFEKQHDLANIVNLYLTILQASSKLAIKKIIQEFSSKAVSSIFPKRNLDENDKQYLIDKFDEIPPEGVHDFYQAADIQLSQIPLERITTRINNGFNNNRFNDSIRLIQVFLKQINPRAYIERLIKADNLNSVLNLSFEHPNDTELQHQIVSMLIQNNKNKQAAEIIKRNKLDKSLFPDLLRLQNIDAVRNKYCPKNDFRLDRGEERLQGHDFMMIHLFDLATQANFQKEAYSIAVRNPGLYQQYERVAQFMTKFSQEDYVENVLLSKDAFGILNYIKQGNTQNVCYGSQEKYLTLLELGISQNDVIFVDSDDEKLRSSIDDILLSDVVGFDTEFNHQYDEFEETGIALMQLATRKKVYLFDTVILAQCQNFVNFINRFLEDENIIKVGHSIANDFGVMQQNLKLREKLIVKGCVDLLDVYQKQQQTKQPSISLMQMVKNVLNCNLSKAESFSNWSRRPLRLVQQHYAAMDAFVCVVLLDSITKNGSPQATIASPQTKGQEEQLKSTIITRGENFRYRTDLNHIFADVTTIKFVVDNMLKKLVSYLRNMGFDTVFMDNTDHKLMENIALQEGRVILTRDKKFFNKDLFAPCYMITNISDTESQYLEMAAFFKIKPQSDDLLKRCVKCNSIEIVIIPKEEAAKYLDFKHPGSYDHIDTFWQCSICKQVYWRGASFNNSLKRFGDMINKNN